MAPTSWATGPFAYVPVNESPYNKSTEPPAGSIFAEGYAGMFVLSHTVVLHASDTTHKSLEPVSGYIAVRHITDKGCDHPRQRTENDSSGGFSDGYGDHIEPDGRS
jgi:hypothetical protein